MMQWLVKFNSKEISVKEHLNKIKRSQTQITFIINLDKARAFCSVFQSCSPRRQGSQSMVLEWIFVNIPCMMLTNRFRCLGNHSWEISLVHNLCSVNESSWVNKENKISADGFPAYNCLATNYFSLKYIQQLMWLFFA